MFLSTYFASFLQTVLGVSTLSGIMPTLAILCVVLAALECVYVLKFRAKALQKLES